MLAKAVLFAAAAVLLLAQVILGDDNVEARNIKGPLYDGYVFINETKYYVNTIDIIKRHEAKAMCESIRMNLVALDSTEKCEMIRSWFLSNGFESIAFSTDGIKDAGNTTWYWETTGAEITEFYWGVKQPDYENPVNLIMCFDFYIHNDNFGWYDDSCNYWYYGVLCE